MSDSHDWHDWIGRTRTSSEVLDPEPARRLQATLGRPMSIAVGDPLPPAWHWLYFHDVALAGDLGGDGHPRLGVFMPPVPLPRRMWAGGRLEFHAPLVLGERAERTSTFTAIDEKHGRSGSLIFVTVDHEIRQDGQRCVTERQDIVYREMPDLTAPAAAVPAEPFAGTLNALAIYGVAGELAARQADGPGSFRVHFLDALARLDKASLGERLRIE